MLFLVDPKLIWALWCPRNPNRPCAKAYWSRWWEIWWHQKRVKPSRNWEFHLNNSRDHRSNHPKCMWDSWQWPREPHGRFVRISLQIFRYRLQIHVKPIKTQQKRQGNPSGSLGDPQRNRPDSLECLYPFYLASEDYKVRLLVFLGSGEITKTLWPCSLCDFAEPLNLRESP